MNTTILRPPPVLGAVEAMRFRDTFKLVVEDGGTRVILDLTGVRELSAAGLAAITNLLAQGRRIGIPVRVLMPEEGSAAARIIDQADLSRFLAPGGMWNALPTGHTGSMEPDSCRSGRRAWLLRYLDGALRRSGDRTHAGERGGDRTRLRREDRDPLQRDAAPRRFATGSGSALKQGAGALRAVPTAQLTETADPRLNPVLTTAEKTKGKSVKKPVGLFAVAGAVAVSMLMMLGAGVALADNPNDPWDGKTYGHAAATMSSYYTPVVAGVIGGQRVSDDCIVISSKRSHYTDARHRKRSRDYLFYLNCSAGVAGGKPGNSVTSAAGQKAKKDQESAKSLQKRLEKNPETCNKSENSFNWCVRLCERTGMCEVPSYSGR